MIAVTLVFSVMFFLMSMVVGGLVGWVYREHTWSQQIARLHPEMYDEDGQYINEELFAVRFVDEEEEEGDDYY